MSCWRLPIHQVDQIHQGKRRTNGVIGPPFRAHDDDQVSGLTPTAAPRFSIELVSDLETVVRHFAGLLANLNLEVSYVHIAADQLVELAERGSPLLVVAAMDFGKVIQAPADRLER